MGNSDSTVGAVGMNYDMLYYLAVAGVVFLLVVWLMIRSTV